MSAPLLSIIVPMYNESDGMELFFSRIIPILNGINPDWEIIAINDGSKDDTLALLKQKHAGDPRIRYISLSRNFGKEAALTAGLFEAKGQAVIPIDADLQDPPELIPQLVVEWNKGFKVVLATRRSRDGDGWIKRHAALGFYKLLSRVTSIDIPENTGDFRLMDAKVVEVIRLLPERTRFMKGLFAWVGFTTTRVYFDRAPRAVGEAKQSAFKLWGLAKDGIFAFTTIPLRLVTYLGLVFSIFAFSYAGLLLTRYILYGRDVPGYTSLMLSMLGVGGIQLFCLGILGEYIGRIYHESKNRPLYVIEDKAG